MAGEDDVLTRDQALEALNVSRPTLHRLINRGVLTPLPKPTHLERRGHLYFRRSDVELARRKILGLPVDVETDDEGE